MEDNIKNIGYIYKINNLINGKIYIGQTTQTIESRWGDHKKSSKNKDKMKYALYRAMSKYGIKNFTIEEIEKCEIDKLNDREVYWISFYDSFNNDKGYNLTLGGGGKKVHNLNEEVVLKQFEELDNVSEVAKIYGCSCDVIKLILDKHNIHIKNSTERGFSVDRYSLDGILLEHYESLHEASIWIKENCEKAKEKNSINISYNLKKHICKKTSYFGFIWKSKDISQEMIDFTINKEKEDKRRRHLESKNLCPICNKNLKTKESSMCSNCRDSFLSETLKFDKNKKYMEQLQNKISKEELMVLVYEKPFDEVGRIYNVSGNTIKKWCKHYCIPFRKEDIIEIRKEDWEKECNLEREEYESKYINTKKEKIIITDQEIIDKYLEIKNLSYLEKFFHKDSKNIKKILKNNGIDLSNTTAKIVLKVQRLNVDSLEIIEEYSSINEAINYVLDNKISNTIDRNVIRKAISHSSSRGRISYGYRWKFIYEE